MRLASALGEKIVSKSSAETLGAFDGVVVDATARAITAVRTGKGRKARLVSWDAISAFGPDAVVVTDDDSLRDPADDDEERWTDGTIDVIGARVLSDRGNEHGTVADIEFDGESGALITIETTVGAPVTADRLRAAGSYAWVVVAADDEATAPL